jgi:hypothetical protein
MGSGDVPEVQQREHTLSDAEMTGNFPLQSFSRKSIGIPKAVASPFRVWLLS